MSSACDRQEATPLGLQLRWRTPRLKRNTSRKVIIVTTTTKIEALITAPMVFWDEESPSCRMRAG